MNKEELIKKLKELQGGGDTEMQHIEADDLLLDYINDKDITEEFCKIKKWYA